MEIKSKTQHVPLRSKYKIGTRQSELALIQTASVIDQLNKFYPQIEYEIIKIKTIGDKNLATPLANIGDKGLFTKELEIELENKNIDFVVHSLKDVPSSSLPANMIIGAILERADPRDAVIIAPWRHEKSLNDLPSGSVIGTSSTRRIAQLKLNYPQFTYKNIRGNMNTRWEKLSNKELGYDAMIVAVAGFQRLKWTDRISQIIESDHILYAIGQGALGIECRHNDKDTIRMLSVLNHEATMIRCIAERAFLKRIEGGCSIPNAVRTEYNDKILTIHGILLNLDGTRYVKDHIENKDLTIPMTTPIPHFLVSPTDDELTTTDDHLQPSDKNLKRKRNKSDDDDDDDDDDVTPLRPPSTTSSIVLSSETIEDSSLFRHYAHVCCININEIILENAEICGTNLAVKLIQMGADNILEEIRQKTTILPIQQ